MSDILAIAYIFAGKFNNTCLYCNIFLMKIFYIAVDTEFKRKNMKIVKNAFVLTGLALMAFSCQQSDSSSKTAFYVRGNCGMCEERIEKAAMDVEGVSKADWDVKTKELAVAYDSTKTTELNIQKAVANAGHETKTEPSPQAVHDALPECCKKGGTM